MRRVIRGRMRAPPPWRTMPTNPGEEACWDGVREDLDQAFENGELPPWHYVWFVGLLNEMFKEDMRSPYHVMAARFCFLCTDWGEV